METILKSPPEAIGAETLPSAGKSAASWSAILAGAVVAASVSLVLLVLGSGLGFASISPWRGTGISAKTFAVTTAIWLIVMQWLSSGVGGYIAGRLRSRWIGTHAHEVFFRDTAHGFVTWAVATVLVAAVLATSAFSVIGEGAQAAAGAASGAARAVMQPGSAAGGTYELDKLFRAAGTVGSTADPRAEVSRIVANGVAAGSLSDADRAYVADLVSARTSIPQADASKRVDELMASAGEAQARIKTDAEAARRVAAQAAIYTALSMLVGAFIASVAAALGGRLRDEHI